MNRRSFLGLLATVLLPPSVLATPRVHGTVSKATPLLEPMAGHVQCDISTRAFHVYNGQTWVRL